MKVTLLGTGSPTPTLSRAGTALTVSVGDETYLVDCGPRTVYELLRNEINPGSISNLLFTHHHVDHNASFPHFAIASWTAGRTSLSVFGPEGTDALIDALYSVYEEDLEYRKAVGYPAAGIEDIEWTKVDNEFEYHDERVTITALPVEHSIETYAYRFESADGETLVFSADTRQIDRLAEFARDADVLIHDAALTPVGSAPTEGFIWERYTTPFSDELRDGLNKTHSSPAEAAETAAEANVDKLVLTHFPPYRDENEIHQAATSIFDGEVYVASDGLTLNVGKAESTV